MLEPDVISHVRDDLTDIDGVMQTEAQGIQAYPIMYAYQQGVTESKIEKKVMERGRLGQKTIKKIDLWKRDASPQRKGKK